MHFLKALFCFLFIFSSLAAKTTIVVVGTGVTGLWSAYSICKDLEVKGKGDDVELVIIGKWDWQKAIKDAEGQKTFAFTHEASGFGPIGIQPHSGLVWNTDNEVVDLVRKGIGKPEASFYTAKDLDDEGKEFLELYTGWHARHPDQENDPASSYQRQGSLIAINRYARQLWGEFKKNSGLSQDDNQLNLYLEGAWRLYDDPIHFANAQNSLKILEKFGYQAEAFYDPEEIAKRIPFYKEAILKDKKMGIFFKDDGLDDSNKVRKYLWAYLTSKNKVTVYQGHGVKELIVDEGCCKGVVLENNKKVPADITILAMGLENKTLLSRYDIQLPLWSVWGACCKAKLKQKALDCPKGGVSFHTQRCITAVPDQETAMVAGTSMVLSKGQIPTPDLYENKLHKAMQDIFKERINDETLRFYVAPRTGIPDDLPIIGLDVPNLKQLVVLNPTSHLGNTQSIALGKIASLFVQKNLGLPATYPTSFGLDMQHYRLDRFSKDSNEVRSRKKESPNEAKSSLF